jgi:invasion protein IalB
LHDGGEITVSRTERSIPCILIAALFLFLGAASGVAQQKTSPATKPAAKSQTMKKPHAELAGAGKVLGPKETLSGTISRVDTTNNLIVLTGTNGVPYNFRVTKGTRITISGKKAGLGELSAQANAQASVQFVPRSKGNFAESITVGS